MSREPVQVTMYTMKTCTYCARAKRLLHEYGVVPHEIVVDADPLTLGDRVAEMVARSGKRSVPQIFIGERYVGGYDELQALHQSGELKTLCA